MDKNSEVEVAGFPAWNAGKTGWLHTGGKVLKLIWKVI